MPQGNAAWYPSGLWYFDPKDSKTTVPKLMFKSARSVFYIYLAYEAFHHYRKMGWTYTYPNFVGKSVFCGNLNTLTHEPLTAEQIDQLRREQGKL